MSDLPLAGPTKAACGCTKQCGRFGTPNRWGCVRGCTCPRCTGRRNRKSGLKKQGQARKALGISGGKFGASNEELWTSLFRNEAKSGKICGPAYTMWQKIEAQVDSNRPTFGDDGRPCRALLMPFGTSDGLVMMRLSAWEQFVRPAMEAYYPGVGS